MFLFFRVLVKFSASQVGKRWKWNKFGPIYERYFCLWFWFIFSYSKKISVQNWAIMEMIYMLFLVLCNILESYIVIARKWNALGLEETSLTSCPPLERFLLTISSIWCHLWKSTQARPMRFSAQFSAVKSSVDTPSREARWLHPRFSSSTVKPPQTYCLQTSNFLDRNGYLFIFLEKGVVL